MTDAERRRWRLWFWVLLVLGPVLGFLALPLNRMLGGALPAPWTPVFAASGPVMVLGLPIVSALGAAFCLARSQIAQRTTGELVVFVLMMGLLFIFTEAAILFTVGSALVRYLK